MLLIPSGKFMFGSDRGEPDEYPRQVMYLHDFYIDKYEGSNRDYLRYIQKTRVQQPLSWGGRVPEGTQLDFPVLATYDEACSYARWAGKRLPTEAEWEKAAGGAEINGPDNSVRETRFPWGDTFNADAVNSMEFWERDDTGKDIKMKYRLFSRSLMPVTAFPSGRSPYGAYNMSGNAMEWTSSWFKPYKGNNTIDSRYGTQYKVLRGGDYCSTWRRVRVTSRQVGGAPNLYSDFAAGFRCVREAGMVDETHKE